MRRIIRSATPPSSLGSEKVLSALELFSNKSTYHTTDAHNSLYKSSDVMVELRKQHSGMCVYCEKDLTDNTPHVEHFRPKSHYWWLAYSWDNLFLSCEECNVRKGDKFEASSKQTSPDARWREDRHNLSSQLNESEVPSLLHPCEIETELEFSFTCDGIAKALSERASYTYSTVQLGREQCVYRRKKLVDDLKIRVQERVFEGEDVTAAVLSEIKSFYGKALKLSGEYPSFRMHLVRSKKLSSFLSEAFSDEPWPVDSSV